MGVDDNGPKFAHLASKGVQQVDTNENVHRTSKVAAAFQARYLFNEPCISLVCEHIASLAIWA